jgi:5-methylcytosine-specific restriction endonuclease McrA
MGEWLHYKRGVRDAVLSKTGGHCFYCGCKLGRAWQVDHIYPRSLVGRDDRLQNLAPSCATCNARKNDFPIEEFRQMQQMRLGITPYVFHFETLGLVLWDPSS